MRTAVSGFALLALGAYAAPAVLAVEGGPPGHAAQQAAEEIRREARLPPQGPQGRPLPLVSHWNMGSQGRGWTPAYQVDLLGRGRHILPWMAWPEGNPHKAERARQRFEDYYGPLLRCCRELGLPISFRGTQWEAMLLDERYQDLPPEKNPATITPEGKVLRKLSPFGPLEPWRDPASQYVDTAGMRAVQQMYPDPPLVLFVSNNEAPDLRWHQVEQLSKRYLDRYGRGRTDEFKRQVVAEGWRERYPVMFEAMRQALVSPAWRKNVRFVGYGAFGPSHFGRWDGWKHYSLITERWTSPEWYIWDGGSPSYYTHNWCDNRDHWVFSTQVESMNWVFQLEEAWQANPDFWWEISLWDGNSADWTAETACTAEAARASKACQYKRDGQTYDPDRYEGWAQFGLWLLRPRAVREFRSSTAPLAPWRPFFERLLAAVDRIYASKTLEEFWRHGRLVANLAHPHPYQHEIPPKYHSVPRWFLLDSNLDPPRPWQLTTNLPVFSLALAIGQEGSQQWLIYAHSPLEDRRGVRLTLPQFGTVTVDVPRRGSFHVVEQASRRVTRLQEGGGR